MKVLVLGGCKPLGAKVVRNLRQLGYPVVADADPKRPAALHGVEVLIDVREPMLFDMGHIPGAHSWMAGGKKGKAAYENLLPSDQHRHGVVVYCDCPNEISAATVAKRLQRAGFSNVRPLEGGLSAWEAAGQLVEGVPDTVVTARVG